MKIICSKFVLLFVLFLSLSCDRDNYQVDNQSNAKQNEVRFATDNKGKIIENLPPEILNLMLNEFTSSQDFKKVKM